MEEQTADFFLNKCGGGGGGCIYKVSPKPDLHRSTV